jgi:hypothetical protein
MYDQLENAKTVKVIINERVCKVIVNYHKGSENQCNNIILKTNDLFATNNFFLQECKTDDVLLPNPNGFIMLTENEVYKTIEINDLFRTNITTKGSSNHNVETHDDNEKKEMNKKESITKKQDLTKSMENIPNFPLNPFLLFNKDYCKERAGKQVDGKLSRKELVDAWKSLSDFEKEKYHRISKRERNRYETICKQNDTIPYKRKKGMKKENKK